MICEFLKYMEVSSIRVHSNYIPVKLRARLCVSREWKVESLDKTREG